MTAFGRNGPDRTMSRQEEAPCTTRSGGRHARVPGGGQPLGGKHAAVRPRRSRVVFLPVLRDHALFCWVLLIAIVVRLIVVLGYPPALWFSDSLPYIQVVYPLWPSRVRPAGYSWFLALLAPFHSVWLITLVQAGMGLAMGAAVYAVLRRHKLTGGAATVAAVPVLFSIYELQIEHFVLSDTLFGLLVTVAVVMMAWSPVPSVPACALSGLILSWAILDREQGALLPVPFCLYLVQAGGRHVRVRAILTRVVTICLTLALPMLGYAWWFEQSNGSFALTSSTGAFLYSRVSTFARCSVIKPPADEPRVCISPSPTTRP